MVRSLRLMPLLRTVFGCAIVLTCVTATAGDWLQFRGSQSNSVVPAAELPTEWSDQENKNIAWKVDLPGSGPSTPLVIGDRVILTSASGVLQDRLHVLCLSAADGRTLWHRQYWATGRTFTHPSITSAAPSPASDGQRIFAFFSSNDLIALDLDGNLLWMRGLAFDFPRAGNDVGMASSPAVIGQTVIVQIENQGDSFAAGINALTGETRWRISRKPAANWASPIFMAGEKPGESLVLLQSTDRLSAHDPLTGAEKWAYEAACQGIPSSVAVEGVVYLPAAGMTAVRPAAGTREPSVLWKAASVQPGAASPLVYNGGLYAVNRSGVLTCADTATGEIKWRLRLEGSFWGTPVLAGDRLYCVNQEGGAQVVQLHADNTAGEIIGRGQLLEPKKEPEKPAAGGRPAPADPNAEKIQSSPVVAGGALYIRSDRQLWKVARRD